jgi:hypothetical protein
MSITPKALESGLKLMRAELKSAPHFDAEKVANWLLLLSDWDDDRFSQAAILAARTLTFFPTVGELRKLMQPSKEDLEIRSTNAWERVRAAIRKHGCNATLLSSDLGGDAHALWAVARMGAYEIGQMTSENRAIKAAEFRRLYATAIENDHKVTYLPGLYETQNRALGLPMDNPALIGRPDLREIPRSLPETPEPFALPEIPKAKRI